MIQAMDMAKSTTLPETPKTNTSQEVEQPKSPFPDSEVEGHIRLDIAKKEKKKKKKQASRRYKKDKSCLCEGFVSQYPVLRTTYLCC